MVGLAAELEQLTFPMFQQLLPYAPELAQLCGAEDTAAVLRDEHEVVTEREHAVELG